MPREGRRSSLRRPFRRIRGVSSGHFDASRGRRIVSPGGPLPLTGSAQHALESVTHRARPGAAYFLGRAPAAFHDDEYIEQFLLPIVTTARLAPGKRCKRWKNRPHVIPLDVGIAVGGLDAFFAEFGLIVLEIEHLGVGFEAMHHVRLGRVRHAARPRSCAKRLDQMAEILATRLRLRRGAPSTKRANNEAHGEPQRFAAGDGEA